MKTRLNKFLAKAGLGTRRQTEKLVKQGKVKVNGAVEKNPGRQVGADDLVEVDGKPISRAVELFYRLFNKAPGRSALENSGWLQTLQEDLNCPQDELIIIGNEPPGICGLMFLTNDSDLHQKLTDSSAKISSVLHFTFDDEISSDTLERLREGIQTESWSWKPLSVNYEEGSSPNHILVEIHHHQMPQLLTLLKTLDLSPTRIDRVHFAGMTKKALSRDRLRKLTREEVIRLRYFGVM
jgi:23S rRNA pseudouridine2605 synthase